MQRLYPTSKAHGTPTDIYDDVDFPAPPEDRPYIALNMVSTVDGKTTLDEGRIDRPIGSPVDRTLMGRLRIPVDAVMRGASTVRRSGYYPAVPEALEHRRIDRGLERQPLAIVVTASGELPLNAGFFVEAPRRPLVLAPESVDPGRLAPLQDRAEIRLVGEEQVDLPAALKLLRNEFGISRLLSEGGPRLNFELLQHGLLDELFWTVAPKIGGHGADLTLVQGPNVLVPMPELQLISAYAGNSELFLRYKVKRQESTSLRRNS